MKITESMGIYSTDVISITDEIKANAFKLLDSIGFDDKVDDDYENMISFIHHDDIECIATIEGGQFKCYFCYTEGECEIIDLSEKFTDSDPQYKHSQQEGLEIFAYNELWKEIPKEHLPDSARGDCDEEAFNYSLMLFMIGVYFKTMQE